MLVSVIHQHESAIGIHISPSTWTSLPPPTPSHPSWLSQSSGLSPTSVSPFLTCKYIHQYHISRFHMFMSAYDIYISLSDLLHSVQLALGSSSTLELSQMCSFLLVSSFLLYIYVPQLLYLFIYQWTSKWLPCPSYCTCILFSYGFLRVYAQ